MMKYFTEHPASVGESYPEHMSNALFFSRKLAAAAFYCLIHAILPFLFTRKASSIIAELNNRMVTNRGGKFPHASPNKAAKPDDTLDEAA